MSVIYKNVSELTSDNMELFPVWEFATDQENLDDNIVRAVADIPVESMANRVVGTKVRLANGVLSWALLGNLNLRSVERTHHFLTLSIFQNVRWFFLARYHDPDYQMHGPTALSEFLGLRSEEIFPIVYDVRYCCVGDPDVVVGTVGKEPQKKLTRAEIIALAVP